MVEVTEGALIGDVSGATAVLESLSALGVTIAIDDFGTGYSSLSHLQLFPVDVIKVDKAFVAGMCGDSEHTTLVRSVLAIAAEFSLQVVAEGIRSEEQHAQLAVSAADYGQGTCTPDPCRRPDRSARGLPRGSTSGRGCRATGPSVPWPDEHRRPGCGAR